MAGTHRQWTHNCTWVVLNLDLPVAGRRLHRVTISFSICVESIRKFHERLCSSADDGCFISRRTRTLVRAIAQMIGHFVFPIKLRNWFAFGKVLSHDTRFVAQISSCLDQKTIVESVWQQARFIVFLKNGAIPHGSRVHNDATKGTESSNGVHKKTDNQNQQQNRPEAERKQYKEEQADPDQEGIDRPDNVATRKFRNVLSNRAPKDAVCICFTDSRHHYQYCEQAEI